MTLKAHFVKTFWEISMLFGAVVLGVLVYMQFGGLEVLTRRHIWQIALLVSTLALRSESFINFHGLSEHAMRQNYFISSILGDITLIILLYYYTPGGAFFLGKETVILSVYIVSKLLVYLMIYANAVQSAKQINAHLSMKRQT